MRLLWILGTLLVALLWATPAQAEEDYTRLDAHNTYLIACNTLKAVERIIVAMRERFGEANVQRNIRDVGSKNSGCALTKVGAISRFEIIKQYEPAGQGSEVVENWVVLIEYPDGLQLYVLLSRRVGRIA